MLQNAATRFLQVRGQMKPNQIADLFDKIQRCLEQKKFTQTKHALERQRERKIDLQDALHVLRTGIHEKRKTIYDEAYQTWKYAIRGKSLDEIDIRVIIAFDSDDMIIITVMEVL